MQSRARELYQPVGIVTHRDRQVSPDSNPELRRDFLEAMAHAVTGVAVITTDGPGGLRGLTVSTVTSVSADPPLILICIREGSPTAEAISRNRHFSVNLLGPRHQQLADAFAGRPASSVERTFTGPAWRRRPGQGPELADAAASFDCTLVRTLRAGSHTILLGACRAARVGRGPGLLYTRRQYGVPNLSPGSDVRSNPGVPVPTGLDSQGGRQ